MRLYFLKCSPIFLGDCEFLPYEPVEFDLVKQEGVVRGNYKFKTWIFKDVEVTFFTEINKEPVWADEVVYKPWKDWMIYPVLYRTEVLKEGEMRELEGTEFFDFVSTREISIEVKHYFCWEHFIRDNIFILQSDNDGFFVERTTILQILKRRYSYKVWKAIESVNAGEDSRFNFLYEIWGKELGYVVVQDYREDIEVYVVYCEGENDGRIYLQDEVCQN